MTAAPPLRMIAYMHPNIPPILSLSLIMHLLCHGHAARAAAHRHPAEKKTHQEGRIS